MKRTNILAILAASALLMGAVAMPVAAEEEQESESDAQSDADHDRHAKRDEARERNAERHQELREKYEARKDAAREKHDDREEAFEEKMKAQKAMRAHKALQGAIQALEHRIVKLEFMEHRIEDALESPNSTDLNQTELEHKLERVEAAQEKMMERLKHLYEKQKALRERWHAHVQGDDAEDSSGSDDLDASESDATESDESVSDGEAPESSSEDEADAGDDSPEDP